MIALTTPPPPAHRCPFANIGARYCPVKLRASCSNNLRCPSSPQPRLHANSPIRPQVHNPVRRLNHVEIVLDHHHRIALLDQAVEDLQEFAHVLKVQARGGLIQNIERLARRALGEFLGEFDPLRLAARKRCRLLAYLSHSPAPPRTASPFCRGWGGRL